MSRQRIQQDKIISNMVAGVKSLPWVVHTATHVTQFFRVFAMSSPTLLLASETMQLAAAPCLFVLACSQFSCGSAKKARVGAAVGAIGAGAMQMLSFADRYAFSKEQTAADPLAYMLFAVGTLALFVLAWGDNDRSRLSNDKMLALFTSALFAACRAVNYNDNCLGMATVLAGVSAMTAVNVVTGTFEEQARLSQSRRP